MADSDIAQQRARRLKGYRTFLLGVLAVSFYLAYLILFPFIDTLILAIVLATMFHPLQIFLERRLKGRKNLAALIIVLIITFVIAIPVFVFTSTLVTQGLDTVNRTNDWLREGKLQQLAQDPRINDFLGKMQERFPFLEVSKAEISNDLLYLSRTIGQFLLGKVASILSNVASLVAHFFIMIFIAFYLVRDGREMVNNIRYYIPLRAEQEDRIINGISVVTKSVLLGTFLTAICQGLAAGTGLRDPEFPGSFLGNLDCACLPHPACRYLSHMGPDRALSRLAGRDQISRFPGYLVYCGERNHRQSRPSLPYEGQIQDVPLLHLPGHTWRGSVFWVARHLVWTAHPQFRHDNAVHIRCGIQGGTDGI